MYYNRWYNGQELNPYNIRLWVRVLPYHDNRLPNMKICKVCNGNLVEDEYHVLITCS